MEDYFLGKYLYARLWLSPFCPLQFSEWATIFKNYAALVRLTEVSIMFKEMDDSHKGYRVKGITREIANAYVDMHTLVNILAKKAVFFPIFCARIFRCLSV